MPTLSEIDRWTQGGSDVVHPKPKRKQRDSFKAAEHYADLWFAQYIKLRDRTCVTKGIREGPCSEVLQCSHVERRGHKMTRYNPMNAYCQCSGCHVYHHTQSESPLRLYAERRIGATGMEMLYSLAQKTVKRTAEELREIGNKYRAMCKEIMDRDIGGVE
jgi:hypothetical protein